VASEDNKTKYARSFAALLEPRWAEIENQSGLRVSSALRALYADHGLITQLELLVQDPDHTAPAGEWSVHQFEPMDASALQPHGPKTDLEIACCFASSYRMHLYGVLLTADGSDGAVFRYTFDGEETRVAPSLGEFLSWPRRRRPIGYEPPAG
jgi:hypothetical protein